MHELSLICELITQVGSDARERGFGKINSVTLHIGAFSYVEQSSLRFGFDLAKQGTILADAVLVIVQKDGNELEIAEYEGELSDAECGG